MFSDILEFLEAAATSAAFASFLSRVACCSSFVAIDLTVVVWKQGVHEEVGGDGIGRAG